MDLVIPEAQINFREICSIFEFIKKFINGRNRKTVTDSDGVEGSVVNTKTSRAIFFFFLIGNTGEE